MPKSVGNRIIERLADFTERLERGEPIEAIQVRREETPDGPLHTHRKVTLMPEPIVPPTPEELAKMLKDADEQERWLWSRIGVKDNCAAHVRRLVAALQQRPDVEAVMQLVEEYGDEREDLGAHPRVGYQASGDALKRVRAALEGSKPHA